MIQPALLLLVLGAAAKPAAPAPTDLVDLLDFDQGTVLRSSTSQYAEGVRDWSAFHLADGDRKVGWCSAQGQPNGNEFVWELEQDSEPKSLRVVNTGVDEGGYPGISARKLELWGAAATGDWAKLLELEAPKNGEKQFAVPAGKPVRRVKLVQRSNWGHAEYTEMMEVDLLGKKVGPAPKLDVSGDYYSPRWNGLRMKQTGTHVDGCYDYSEGVFSGELEGRVAKGVWREFQEGKEVSHGTVTFIVAPDKSNVRGIYYGSEGNVGDEWNLEKPADDEQRPKCTPPGQTMADQLKRSGRIVLYGIRFDVNSDVPRADSAPTLEQVLEVLKKDAALKLQIEGHTDSTNTDAYNQDLSERRARAVVRWLTDHGVAAERLKGVGFGRTKPVASNDTAQGRALNRRVELATMGK